MAAGKDDVAAKNVWKSECASIDLAPGPHHTRLDCRALGADLLYRLRALHNRLGLSDGAALRGYLLIISASALLWLLSAEP